MIYLFFCDPCELTWGALLLWVEQLTSHHCIFIDQVIRQNWQCLQNMKNHLLALFFFFLNHYIVLKVLLVTHCKKSKQCNLGNLFFIIMWWQLGSPCFPVHSSTVALICSWGSFTTHTNTPCLRKGARMLSLSNLIYLNDYLMATSDFVFFCSSRHLKM